MPLIEEKEDDHHHHHHHQQLQQPSNAIEALPESYSLPTEIIVQILLKLPVESLLRCKSVCKSWHSLISDTHFVKSHLNLSSHNRLIFSLGDGTVLKTCCLNDVGAGNIINNGSEVVDFPLKSECESVRVVGSCNGLLCLVIRKMTLNFRYPAVLFIWNPSTRIYHKLPSDDVYKTYLSTVNYGFGYDESTDDYKVVSIFEEKVKMYSLRNGSWKDIGACEPLDLFGTFLNGALHWAVCDGDHWAIVSLDLATKTYGEVVPPVYDEDEKELRLGTLGEWLCVLCDYDQIRVDLWAMKVYGVQDSWTKLFTIPYTPDSYIDYPLLAPLCISNDGKILLRFGTKLIIYDSNSSTFSDVQNFDEDVEEASIFFESLVSPLPPATSLEHRVADSNG